MRKLLQIIIKCFRRKHLIRFITSALSVGTCICAKFGRFELKFQGGDNMFGKQYFKVDLFIDKKSVTHLYEEIAAVQNSDANSAIQIQCVHTEKKIPCITVQVRGAVRVTDLVQMLLEFTDNFGYVVWLSNEDDFNAVKECTLSIFNIDNMNVLVDVPNHKDKGDVDNGEEGVDKDDDESIETSGA